MALEGLAFAQLFGLLVFILCAAVLITVPCWCIGRFVVYRRRKKFIAAGGTPPLPPSRLRKTVQGLVSMIMIALWFTIVYFIISQYAYPLFASKPLPYTESCLVRGGSNSNLWLDRGWTNVHIYPIKPDDYSTEELVATCAAAAKYYADKFGQPASLRISVCPKKNKPLEYYKANSLQYPWNPSRSLGGIQEYCEVAFCVYEPHLSNKWGNFIVSTNADNIQPEVNYLWIENEDKYQKESKTEAENSLKKLISEKLGIPLAKAIPKKFNLKKVPSFLIPDIAPQEPVNTEPTDLN